jgi:glycosyltransferase involved in cell wall biosynthesis
MPHLDLLLIVPCYNEAARLDARAFVEFLAARPAVALLFVDDGSSDGTPEILERLRMAAPGSIGVLRLPHAGKGEAVRRGVLEGLRRGLPLVGFWDADLATPLAAVDDFLALARKRPDLDLILGSRVNLLGRHVHRSSWRHYPGRAFATAVSMALGLAVYDTQCGAKVFRAGDSVAAVFTQPFRSRWVFDVEVLARYLRVPVLDAGPPRSSRIYELTLPAWHDVAGSKLRWTDWARSFFDLMAVWHERRRAARSLRR